MDYSKKQNIATIILVILITIMMGLIGGGIMGSIDRINDRKERELIFNHLPVNENSKIIGVGSFYDYVLDNGWSSVGHHVCATRNFIRYRNVKVTNLDNGKITRCAVTDYGPEEAVHPDRFIDLSSTAFMALSPSGTLKEGLLLNLLIEQE